MPLCHQKWQKTGCLPPWGGVVNAGKTQKPAIRHRTLTY